jgi:hypothetical protein
MAVETERRYYFGHIIGRNAISKANTMCSRVTMQHNGTLTDTKYKLHLREIQNGRLETGSRCSFASIIGRNATSNANTTFSNVADKMERRLIGLLNDSCV